MFLTLQVVYMRYDIQQSTVVSTLITAVTKITSSLCTCRLCKSLLLIWFLVIIHTSESHQQKHSYFFLQHRYIIAVHTATCYVLAYDCIFYFSHFSVTEDSLSATFHTTYIILLLFLIFLDFFSEYYSILDAQVLRHSLH